MVDQTINAKIANSLQQLIDGSVDSRLESNIDSRVCSTIVHLNDEFNKKQLESVKL